MTGNRLTGAGSHTCRYRRGNTLFRQLSPIESIRANGWEYKFLSLLFEAQRMSPFNLAISPIKGFIMYTFNRYQAKELALAYMSSKQHVLSPSEFLLQIKKVERTFADLINHPTESLKA